MRITSPTPQQLGLNRLASFSKRGLVHSLLYESQFCLYVNENWFSYERLCTKSRFENEVKTISHPCQCSVALRCSMGFSYRFLWAWDGLVGCLVRSKSKRNWLKFKRFVDKTYFSWSWYSLISTFGMPVDFMYVFPICRTKRLNTRFPIRLLTIHLRVLTLGTCCMIFVFSTGRSKANTDYSLNTMESKLLTWESPLHFRAVFKWVS